jgi:nitrogen fixation protein NifU and related proteins
MTDTTRLYQDLILDHNRRPKNYGELPEANRRAEGKNPLCGDQLTLWLRMNGDVIEDIRFVGSGCAISRASASMMTGAVKGKTRDEAEALYGRFHDLVTGTAADGGAEALGKLAAFAGVSRFPSRVKCASLPWHALHAALEQPSGAPEVTSE